MTSSATRSAPLSDTSSRDCPAQIIMLTPRAKPWEQGAGAQAVASAAAPAEALPERPQSLADSTNTINSANSLNLGFSSGYGMGSMGSMGSRYGSGMYGSSYGSGMYGGYGSSMYGGGYGLGGMYGGYGGGLGGYGSGMYGQGMYGNGMQGPGPLGEGTQATFQLIELIIGAVGGFAQMLEATYMATHLLFFTMVSLAEQFGNLKNALGSLLGIFALIKFAKKIFYKVSGKTYNHGISAKEFSKFELLQRKLEELLRKGNKPRILFKPLLMFLAALIGLPYLLSKAIQRLNQQQQAQQQRRLQEPLLAPDQLEFAKALYEFNPENPNIEIELQPKELVAILLKLDPLGNESKWWKVRSRAGKVGYVPLNYLAIIERKAPKQVEPAPAAEPKPLVEDFKKFLAQ